MNENEKNSNNINKCVRCGCINTTEVLGNHCCDDCKEDVSLAITLLELGEMNEFKMLTKGWWQQVKKFCKV